ncbi:MAG: Lysylphosphatidylglycerol synthase region [Thermomicrobiales bacterium]|nr:Lysylphosphatidylglycerol synthase region [Thermomicrobiales bacterium]
MTLSAPSSADRPAEVTEDARSPASSRPGQVVGLLRRIRSLPTPLIFALAIAIAAFVLWRQGSIGDVETAVRRADRGTILTALALYPGALALLCLRWHLLVRMIKGVSSLPKASEAFLVSVVLNYTAPVSVASASRAVLTKRSLGLSATETGAIALWEVAADLLVLALGALLWLALGGHAGDIAGALPKNTVLFAAVLLALFILTVAAASIVLRRRPRLRERLLVALRTVITAPGNRPGDAVLASITTVVYWTVQTTVLWSLLRALAGTSDPVLALGLVTFPVLLGMLSGLPGGAGVREALMVAVARVHHADTAAVLVTAITYRILLFAAIPILYGAVRIWLSHAARSDHGPITTAVSGESE